MYYVDVFTLEYYLQGIKDDLDREKVDGRERDRQYEASTGEHINQVIHIQ